MPPKEREFTPLIHPVLRISLRQGKRAGDFDGLIRSYFVVASCTTEHTDLVTWLDAEQLARLRDVELKTFARHLRQLEALGLIARFPLCEVTSHGRDGEMGVYLLPVPNWVFEIAKKLDAIAKTRVNSPRERDRLAALTHELRAEQQKVLKRIKGIS